MKALIEEHSDIKTAPQLIDYYRWHARIYDATRWAFLFGRKDMIQCAAEKLSPRRILEIGCGTGKNLVALAQQFPDAEIVGLDLSADMLERARPKLVPYIDRVSLLHRAYDAPVSELEKFDLIVCSYSLSMINPGFEDVIAHAREDLSENGSIAVVDFNDSPVSWFRRWMGVNHVMMKGQILEALEKGFSATHQSVNSAYGGLWRYIIYLGKPAG